MNRLDLAGAPMNTLMVATTDAAKPLLGLPRTIGVAVVIALACGGFIIWDCSSRDGTSIKWQHHQFARERPHGRLCGMDADDAAVCLPDLVE